MGGRGSSGNRNITSYENPTIGGNYKATDAMISLATEVYRDMQKDFPVLQDSVEIRYSKYLGAAGEGFENYIELNGAYYKKLLNKNDNYYTTELQATVAHELTHTIQERINSRNNIFDKTGNNRENNIERIWNSAVNQYLKANPGSSVKEVNTLVSKAYGGGGHSRTGSSATERMAVAVENAYRVKYSNGKNGNKTIAEIGRRVIEQLKKETKGLRK